MHKLLITLATSFFLFIVWIIYLANTGQSIGLFKWVIMIPYGDKIGHLGLFGLLTLLVNLSSKCRGFSVRRFNIYWGSFCVLTFVTLEELSQHLLPTRTLDIYDYAADLIGISCATFLSWLLNKYYFSPKYKEH